VPNGNRLSLKKSLLHFLRKLICVHRLSLSFDLF
jgi:hypothetical protein